MEIRNRIVGLRNVPAAALRPHPRHWRKHPPRQRAALAAALEQIGYAGALLARQTAEGLELIDGHLRAETTPQQSVPVLVVDLDEREADALLAVFDPLAALAVEDARRYADLLETIDRQEESAGRMLEQIRRELDSRPSPPRDPPEIELPEVFQVVVECADESQQRALYEQLSRQGHRCRLVTL